MEPQTIFLLSLQLIALFSIAGALLLYLLCKVRSRNREEETLVGHTVLITSADTALGLQLATHFAHRGCRVFAGMKDPAESLSAKLLKGWIKSKENTEVPLIGSILPLKLDVTKEDVLKDAVDAIGSYLNVGEKGIHAVINTSGCVFRGKIETQNSLMWENMFKVNVLGALRIARAFFSLLKPTRGRLIFFGTGHSERDLVAFAACRQAIEGCAQALREEFKPYGVNVVTIDSTGVQSESLFRDPIPFSEWIVIYELALFNNTLLVSHPVIDTAENAAAHHPMQYSAEVLTQNALNVIEQSLWDATPDNQYALAAPVRFVFPCRSANNIIKRSNSQKSEKTGHVVVGAAAASTPKDHHERIQSV